MTNKNKAKEIAKKYQTPCHGMGDCEFEAYQSALEAMEWKEQILIDKACKWLRENKNKYVYNWGERGGYYPTCSNLLIKDFKNYMKGGEE